LRLLTVASVSFWGLSDFSGGLAEEQRTDTERLGGTWIFDTAATRETNEVSRLWTSKVVVTGDAFSVSKFMDLSKDLKGKVVLNSVAAPATIDLTIEELDFAAAGAPIAAKIPSCTLAGIYKLDNDRLTISLSLEPGGPRP